jgi:DNA-binding IclR family transcriptional regulator
MPQPAPTAADISAGKSTVNSVLKALNILECFTAETPEYSVAELARLTGINKATCHRLVATMVQAGWLQRSADANYRPTLKVFRIGSPALGGIDLRDQCRDILRELASHFGDTAYLMVADGIRAVCLDRVEGSNPVQVNIVDIGSSLPLNVGAAPLAILAYRNDLLERLSTGDLQRFTPKTMSSMTALNKSLAEVRRRGYSISLEDIIDGVGAIGAPIRGGDGDVVGALSLGGLAGRFQPPRQEEIAAAVTNAAKAASARLGFTG